MKIVSRQVIYKAPRPGTSAYETTHYTRATGLERIRFRLLDISDDVPGPRSTAISPDNGRTWPEPVHVSQPHKVKGGILRTWPCVYFVDPVLDRQVVVALEGVFPTESFEHGYSAYYLTYRVSVDGGRTALVEEPIIQQGYTPEHPIPGVWIGHNAFTNPGRPGILRLADGRLLMVMSKTVLGPDGKLYIPGSNWDWLEVQVFHGFWRDDGRIEWHAGPIISITPDLSTRGICEPSLASLPDGRIMCVMRASNGGSADPGGRMPAHKWLSVSHDHGATWSFPEPWCCDDGQAFFSPSSISQLLWLDDGRLVWFGNVCQTNPNGNLPRDRLYVGEIDPKSLRLIRDSLLLLTEQAPGEPPTQFSNFDVEQDRQSGELLLHLPWFVQQTGGMWGADTWLYRIDPKPR